ncbi:MAG: hypothetical protein UV09_C0010G0013 [Candidatus Gottesmanbacteria bacterium GW2011_GWA2_42_18]|uniref:Uncharacterized protein n=1 Tax=Candidatus Gottesmanbacteria bacterium GW2011_GWA2_42_18 TaxID=1618442 RepID=A0A0G1CBH9_9BACT|nr:MAG: hypothetical protein UV09_C0010G0013 [Candidatus Gottesmanbacteria bacterium GW2011_GWA2_42_18]
MKKKRKITKLKPTIGKALKSLTTIKARGPKDLSSNIDKYLYGE